MARPSQGKQCPTYSLELQSYKFLLIGIGNADALSRIHNDNDAPKQPTNLIVAGEGSREECKRLVSTTVEPLLTATPE